MSKKLPFLVSLLFTLSLQAQKDSVKSFSLDQAVQYGLSNHANAKNADLDILKGKHFVTEQIALGLPQINANVDYQYFIKPAVFILPAQVTGGPAGTYVAIPASPLNSMNMGVTAAMPLVNGQYFIGIEAAKAFKNLLADQKIKTLQGVKEEVIKAYYLALIAQESKKVVDSTLKILDETVKQTEQIYNEGLIEELDVKQLKLTQAQARDMQIQLESNVALTMYALKYQMSYPIESEIILTDKLEPLIASNNFDSTITNLRDSVDVKSNIDYKLISHKINLDKYQFKLQRASAYPTLSTFFQVGINTFNSQRWIFLDGTQANLNGIIWGVSLKVPIFSSWNRVSKLKQLKIEIQKDQNTQAMVESGLKLGFLSSKVNVQNNYNKLKTARDNFDLAGEIRRVNTIKYKEGLISSLNLTQAESQYFTAQQKYFQTIYDLLLSKIAMDKSMNQF